MSKVFRKIFLDPLEFLPLFFVYAFFKILPVRASSFLGGFLARHICPFLPAHRVGVKNIQKAFPKLSLQKREEILRSAWENLGRVVGEFPHLKKIARDHTQVVDRCDLKAGQKEPQAHIFFSAHMANWEIPHLVLTGLGMKIHLLSRPPNNWVTRQFFKWVRYDPKVSIILKGPEGGKDFLRTLQTGENMGILLDQRLSEGEKIPFFGRLAYTPVVPARVAYRLGAHMIPVQVERLKGVSFRITYHKPLVLKKEAVTSAQMINQLYEKWITENPDQWLWFHNRWK